MANGYLVDARGNIQMPLVGDESLVLHLPARDTIVSKLGVTLLTPR